PEGEMLTKRSKWSVLPSESGISPVQWTSFSPGAGFVGGNGPYAWKMRTVVEPTTWRSAPKPRSVMMNVVDPHVSGPGPKDDGPKGRTGGMVADAGTVPIATVSAALMIAVASILLIAVSPRARVPLPTDDTRTLVHPVR